MRLSAALVLTVLGGIACTASPPADEAPRPAPPKTEPEPAPELSEAARERAAQQAYWVERTDAELQAAFQATCEAALADGKPVLVNFTADWCPDCKRMYALGKQDPLAGELDRWHMLVVDPGRFDRHADTLAAFDVTRIVTWVAARPTDCAVPAAEWPRLSQAVFEPQTGEPWTAEQITGWLTQARGQDHP